MGSCKLKESVVDAFCVVQIGLVVLNPNLQFLNVINLYIRSHLQDTNQLVVTLLFYEKRTP